ncbi:MAG: ATPase [Chloroflexota bacterium]|nr:MAG: ATPase [Chloroflexota bacterium]
MTTRALAPGQERAAWGPTGRGYFGVEGLDDLLPVGLSYDTQIMVLGDTGVGKTVLAAQFMYEGLLVGDTCVFIACDEPPELMRRNIANFRLGTAVYEQLDRLVFVDAYARERSTERYRIPNPDNFDEFFAYERDILDKLGDRPLRLVVDSISTMMGTADPTAILEFNRSRLRYLRAKHVLTMDNYVTGLLEERTIAGLSHAYPLIVKMGYRQVDGDAMRYVQLGKLRSGQFTAKQLSFTIDPRTGIVVQRQS